MNSCEMYLINEIEKYCKQTGEIPSEIYYKLSELYQAEYGVNILMEMESEGLHNMSKFLADKGIVDRYINLLNKLK